MALISLAEYALKNGKSARQMRQKAAAGGFETAQKIGRNWVIDEDEPYKDLRIKSGDYKNWRNKMKEDVFYASPRILNDIEDLIGYEKFNQWNMETETYPADEWNEFDYRPLKTLEKYGVYESDLYDTEVINIEYNGKFWEEITQAPRD